MSVLIGVCVSFVELGPANGSIYERLPTNFISALIGTVVSFIIIALLPSFREYLLLKTIYSQNIAFSLLKSSLKIGISTLQSPIYKKHLRKRLFFNIIDTSIFIILLLFIIIIYSNKSPWNSMALNSFSSPNSFSSIELFIEQFNLIDMVFSSQESKYLITGIIAIWVLVFFISAFDYYIGPKIVSKFALKVINNKMNFDLRRRLAYLYTISFAIILITIIISSIFRNKPDDLSLISKLNMNLKEYLVKNKQIKKLDLRDKTLNESNIKAIYSLNNIDSLILPCKAGYNIDGSRLSELKYLSVNAGSIRFIEDVSTSEMEIFDVDGLKSVNNFPNINKLILKGKIHDLKKILKYFPKLFELSIEDTNQILYNKTIPEFYNNLRLKVISYSKPKLFWMNDTWSKYIIELNHPINESTVNLDKLVRLSVPADSLLPKFLSKAVKLKWLNIRVDNEQSSEWYQQLLTSVKNCMPEIRTLEVKGKNSSLFAFDRAHLISMLEKLIKQPQLK
jgi:hypothetical protein